MPDRGDLFRFDLRSFQRALAWVFRVGLLVEDVVDAVDQEVERQREPHQERQCLPPPQVAREPNPDQGGANGVDPEQRPRDVKEPPEHDSNIPARVTAIEIACTSDTLAPALSPTPARRERPLL